MKKTLFITGGLGFIGSALVRYVLQQGDWRVVNLDKCNYAANPHALADLSTEPNYHFYQINVADSDRVESLLVQYQAQGMIHLAAQTHVDNSISGPAPFIEDNISATYHLLHTVLTYYQSLSVEAQARFRFHYVSTDEVYGDIPVSQAPVSEDQPFAPSSPYSASKAAAEHLVNAWARTYGLPAIITRSSNNYGVGQFAEKLIPLMVERALYGLPMPVYGDGLQVRDWLALEDHVLGLYEVFTRAAPGAIYNMGADNPRSNLQLIQCISEILQNYFPAERNPYLVAQGLRYADLIQFVADRPGHDRRYAISSEKIKRELAWSARCDFTQTFTHTVVAIAQGIVAGESYARD